MTKKIVIFGLVVFAVMTGISIRCTNPIDEPPLRWRSNVEIPVSNERFLVGEELGNMFSFEDLDILNVLERYYSDPTELQPDTIKGDTVVFSASMSDSSEFENHETAFADKTFHVKVGPIPISNAPTMRDTFPLPAAAGSFNVPVPFTFDDVYEVIFSNSTGNVLQVQLTNLGPVPVTGVAFGIKDIDTIPVGVIAAGAKATVSIPVAGKRLVNPVGLYLGATVVAAARQAIGIEFSLNGLKADKLLVAGRLVDFRLEFINPYELTDTVDIDYIDIGTGFFQYKIMNYTGLDLNVQGVHQHMWMADFSEGRRLTHYEELADLNSDDSAQGYFGKITRAKNVVDAHTEQEFSILNLSNTRLFPEWSDSLKKSVTKVKYIVTPDVSANDTVAISSTDSLRFTISTREFKFKELQGTLTESYNRQSDTQMVAINLPWNNSVKDSLRGKFILEKVWGDILVRTEMPDRSFLDTLLIDFIAFAPESAVVRDSLFTALRHVSHDSTYFRSINITDVANTYSDSVAIAVQVHVPKGTTMRIVNDLDVHDVDFDKYIGRMIIHVNTSYRLNAKLDWEVKAPVNMDLGSSRVKLAEAFRFFRKLDDRQATFDMQLKNNSNLNMSLFALVATDALMDTLDSLSMNEMHQYITNSGYAASSGFVNLLGDTGILLPKRDTLKEQRNSVVLNEQQIETMFSADSINFRWWAQFRVQARDALSDTDYIELKSRFGLQGINTTDSLLIWE